MKQVDFYLISNQLRDAKFKFASRLCNKLNRLDKRALVITDNADDTGTLSSAMWALRDQSFLAHERIDQQQNQDLDLLKQHNLHPIVVGDHLSINSTLLDQGFDVMINLAKDVPLFSHHFSRIAEVIEADDESKAAGRARFKRYQGEGFEISTHNIQL